MRGEFRRTKIASKGAGPRPPGFADVFYLSELGLQCDFARAAFGEVQTRAKAGATDASLFAYAHMLLVFGGNACKLLYPSPKAPATARARGERLRVLLGVANISPPGLADARNYCEHFDERMDRYLNAPRPGPDLLLHRLVAPVIPTEFAMDDGQLVAPRFLQVLSTQSLKLVLYEQSISLQDIEREVALIAAKTLAAQQNLPSAPG